MNLSFGWFSSYAQNNNRDIYQQNGLILYGRSQSDIPAYVIFIPASADKDKQIDLFIERVLGDKKAKGYILYFQGLRWLMPDLKNQIEKLKHKTLLYGIKENQQILSYVTFLFDRTFKGDPEVPEEISHTVVPLKYKDHFYSLNIEDWPSEFGIVKWFEPLEEGF